MPTDEIRYSPSQVNGPLHQGEILSGLTQFRLDLQSIENPDEWLFNPEEHSFSVILSQDCDLDIDFYKGRKGGEEHNLVHNILFCTLKPATQLRGKDPGQLNSSLWDPVKKNQHSRYHFLSKIDAHHDTLGEVIGELVADFRRYFTLPTEEVYEWLRRGKAKRRCRLICPYREDLNNRFCFYQSRIPLPIPHESES